MKGDLKRRSGVSREAFAAALTAAFGRPSCFLSIHGMPPGLPAAFRTDKGKTGEG